MRINCFSSLGATCAALTLAALGGCQSSGGSSGSGNGKPAVKVDPSAVQALAKSPTPPPGAKKATSIGSGQLTINTQDGPGDDDSCWVQQIDIDGDGDVEETTVLWDDEDKILFASANTEAPCDLGGTAVASLLIAVNAAGNTRGAAAGSGVYAAYLDASECFVESAGLYGCRFDADGDILVAGAAVIDEVTGEVTIVTYQRD